MKSSLERHKEELQKIAALKSKDETEFLESFKNPYLEGVQSNSIRYILDLRKMSYKYINNACYSFTGFKSEEFYGKGLNILPEIMLEIDFKSLSNELFPEMNSFSENLNLEEKKSMVFELHYHMKNSLTGKVTPVVEYSSYALFDDEHKPAISTGVCYESVLDFNGVRGLIRLNLEDEQETIYDRTIHYSKYVLTRSEKKILDHVLSGRDFNYIAQVEHISPHTVKTHIKNIYKKLNVSKLSELINYFKPN